MKNGSSRPNFLGQIQVLRISVGRLTFSLRRDSVPDMHALQSGVWQQFQPLFGDFFIALDTVTERAVLAAAQCRFICWASSNP